MGIRFHCPSCQKRLNVKSFLAGKRGICPYCDSGLDIPLESEPRNGKKPHPTQSIEVQTVPRQEAAEQASTSAAVPRVETSGPRQSPITESERPVAAGGETPPDESFEQPAGDAAAAGPDPIDENPDAVWYVRPPSGGQFGPAKGDVMRKWIAEGRVSPDSLVWREGWPEWQEAEPTFPALSKRSSPPPPPSRPGPEPAASSEPVQAVAVASPAPRVVAAESAAAPAPEPEPKADHTATKTLHRRRSQLPALIAVIALVLISIGLLVGLIVVLASK